MSVEENAEPTDLLVDLLDLHGLPDISAKGSKK